jgi:hypothetical protein
VFERQRSPSRSGRRSATHRRGREHRFRLRIELIFTGKARQSNRKFLQMASHHLIEPVACTLAAEWE